MDQTAIQQFLATPLGRRFSIDAGELHHFFPEENISALAHALGDPNHAIYTSVGLGRCFQADGERDIACMPHQGPEVAQIKLHRVSTTPFAVRQYALEIGSQPHEIDRMAYLLDFYDTTQNKQLLEVPYGYTFWASTHKTESIESGGGQFMGVQMGSSLEMQPAVLGVHRTIMAVRGVQFEVRKGSDVLLKFIAQ
ncbi:hypothetical protein C8R45DRAFT_307880 [Mycena sanguinolenta]|nr:hypothetical protein C8R45DRAFT_307880 [Mycena sanguinolenta]